MFVACPCIILENDGIFYRSPYITEDWGGGGDTGE